MARSTLSPGPSRDNRFGAYLRRQASCTGGSVAPNFSADGTAFWYATGGPENTRIMLVDLATGASRPRFDVDSVRRAFAVATGHEPPGAGLPFDTFVEESDGAVRFRAASMTWRLDPTSGRIDALPTPGDDDFATPRTWLRDFHSLSLPTLEARSPDGRTFASIEAGDLVLRSALTGRTRRLTHDATADVRWDIESRRMRLRPGMVLDANDVDPWRPDGLALAATVRDTTGVFRLPEVHWLEAFEDVAFVTAEKAGARLTRVTPSIIDIRSGRTITAALGDTDDCYVQFLRWLPNGSHALFIVYSRDFKEVRIVAADARSGTWEVVLRERAPTFVKIQHEVIYYGVHGFTLMPDSDHFLWQSTRDGHNHLYLYTIGGKLVRQLTSGTWPVYDVAGVGTDGFVYFTAAVDTDRPYDVHVCRVPQAGGNVEQLTRERGIHAAVLAPSGKAFLDTHSAYDRPLQTELRTMSGTHLATVATMDISALIAAGYTPPQEFTVTAADGVTDLWGVLYKPADFDAANVYPVIEWLYAGPQLIAVPRHFAVAPSMARNLPWALAQLGYVVVCLDGRGTPGRSKAFQDVVYGAWGVNEIPDHAGALRQLFERHAFLDPTRVGIIGHSWGGYFSTCALIQAPDIYHAAIASSPGYDPWDSILYEPYLDLPTRNRQAYQHADLIGHAGDLKGHLLIVAGTLEAPVFPSAVKMTRALIDAGILHEFVVLPGEFHAYHGTTETYFYAKVVDWFERHVMRREATR